MLRQPLVPLAAALLFLGPTTPRQDGAAKDIFGRSLPAKEGELDRRQPFLGAWRLVSMVDQELPEAGRSEEGYVLFTPQYMALEWHVKWDRPGGDPADDDFSSGIHTWDLDSLGRLTTGILIGAFLDEESDLEYERPGNAWTFLARVSGGMLTLQRTDGSRMTFVRHNGGVGAGMDIFGRNVGATETVDIFGRDVKPKAEDTGDDDGDGDGD